MTSSSYHELRYSVMKILMLTILRIKTTTFTESNAVLADTLTRQVNNLNFHIKELA